MSQSVYKTLLYVLENAIYLKCRFWYDNIVLNYNLYKQYFGFSINPTTLWSRKTSRIIVKRLLGINTVRVYSVITIVTI